MRRTTRGKWAVWALACLGSIPGGAPAQTTVQRDLVRVRAEDDERPWLSLNTRGHTGTVQSLAFTPDSRRLCSAGLDKVMQVWDASVVVRDLRRTWLLERTLRWQVGRGLRGSIYALASAPPDGMVAIGGYGAMGSLGEILLVDPLQGTLQKVLEGHRQTITALSFSSDGEWLASIDAAGQAALWKRGAWQQSRLYGPDVEVYGARKAELVERQPKFRRIAIVGNTHVVVPVFLGAAPDGRLRWKLQQIGIADRQDLSTFDTVHWGMVTALAVSADGKWLGSADLAGNLYVWDLGQGGRVARLPGDQVVLSLAFSPRGDMLVAGTQVSPADGKSQLQIWDVPARQIKARRLLSDHVHACALSPDGRRLAYSGGDNHEILLGALDAFPDGAALGGTGRRILKVAFAKDEPLYRVAFGTGYRDGGFNDYAQLEQSFDATRLELGPAGPPEQADWLEADQFRGSWRAQKQPDGVLQLYRDDAPRGYVRFDPRTEGTPRSYCWLADGQRRPFAIAVGTDVQNSIYVCRLADEGACPILRRFRGHQDYVASLGVSRDMRYLVSGSADGTVRFWSLADHRQGTTLWGKWGADFAVEGGRLVVARVHPAGPLFHKGVREGDVLRRIGWHDGRAAAAEGRARGIVRQLGALPWGTQVVFDYARGGAARPGFQLLPAWQPLVTLFTSTDREWAFWTPEGYYDASANGHTLFGWQVNRGLAALPDFYRADQFRRNLERPQVLEHLLPAGSLDEAFRRSALAPPGQPDQVVHQQVAATPRVTIVAPLAGQTLRTSSATVRARVRLPVGGGVVRAKVFANGVVAPRARLLDEQEGPDGKELVYEWDVALPAEQRNLIQVVVGTAAQTAAFSNVVIERADIGEGPPRPPRLYLLAVGIDEYRDPGVQALTYSVADARGVVELLQARSPDLYAVDQPTVLVNQDVTRATWQKSFADLSQKLSQDAGPDDLLVIFLAGHGFVDPQSRQYHFAGYDINPQDLVQGVYSGSISWSDFELLADIPCRKLAFLDTCHSGAIQPLRQRNLKAAIRAFQEDVVFTVTASAGHERSEENAQWQHGAFTKSLLEALGGAADTSADGTVTLNEAVAYVQQAVPQLTEGRQNPMAAPDDFLPFVTLRLTRAGP